MIAPYAPPSRVAITGVTKGLGRALAVNFARGGTHVLGCARDEGALAELSAVLGPRHVLMRASVDDQDETDRFALAARSHGPLDLVIANAGIINDRGVSWTIDLETWRHSIDVNLMGVVHTARSFLPVLLAQNRGLFIAMSSGWGRSASAGLAPYCASKFAVEGMIESMTKELDGQGSAVRAIALNPGGGIQTDMLQRCLPDEFDDYRSADDWGPGAVAYISEALFATRASGSLTIPESAHQVVTSA